jgi:hypothetical protein
MMANVVQNSITYMVCLEAECTNNGFKVNSNNSRSLDSDSTLHRRSVGAIENKYECNREACPIAKLPKKCELWDSMNT